MFRTIGQGSSLSVHPTPLLGTEVCFMLCSDMWEVSPSKSQALFISGQVLFKYSLCLIYATVFWGRSLYHYPILQGRRLRERELLSKLFTWEVAESEFRPRQLKPGPAPAPNLWTYPLTSHIPTESMEVLSQATQNPPTSPPNSYCYFYFGWKQT